MQLPLTPILRLPRVLLEHSLPQEGPGISPSCDFISRDGAPLVLTFGGVDKWGRSGAACPGFTLDSLTVLAALLSLTERMSGGQITYNQLFKALGSRSCCSAHHREALKSSLALLELIDLKIDNPAAAAPPRFEKLLTLEAAHTRPIFGRAALALAVHFSPALLDCLADPKASAPVHFQSLVSLRSRVARSLYLILSTWAHYSRAHPQRPFRITLSRLLTHLGMAPLRFRCQRRAFFFGHRARSLFDEINGLPTPYGFLRLQLSDATSVDDDCLLVYHGEQVGARSPYASAQGPLALGTQDIQTHSLDGAGISRLPKIIGRVESSGVSCRHRLDPSAVALAKEEETKVETAPLFEVGRTSEGKLSEGASSQTSAAPLAWPSLRRAPAPVRPQPREAPSSIDSRISALPSQDSLASYRHLKLYAAWAASGRPDAEFLRRVRSTSITLTQDDLSLLLAARIPPSSCESFLTMSKKLLPSRTWLDLLGEAKYAAHASLPPKSPAGKLINEILSALRVAL